MSTNWTPDQKKVIDLRNRNLLVSAAAGSGKTAVLIERILSLISDPVRPVDIDELLVVTFTRAAAGEMRERLNAAIEKKLSEGEEDEHLTRQLTLIQSAQITTIDRDGLQRFLGTASFDDRNKVVIAISQYLNL